MTNDKLLIEALEALKTASNQLTDLGKSTAWIDSIISKIEGVKS